MGRIDTLLLLLLRKEDDEVTVDDSEVDVGVAVLR
jgi:hypothetical protein